MKKRVFLIGIPHFDWKLVKLLIEREDFKNLRKLLEKSSYGDVFPQQEHCSSPVEFTSMITGVKKEKHSIGYGKGSDKEYVKDGRLITRLDIKTKTVWKIVEENGKKVGIYHWLLTWPPEKVDGFMITGRLSQDKNKTYPKKLREVLPESEFTVANRFNPSTAIQLIKTFDVDLFIGMDEGAHGPNHSLWEFIESESKSKETLNGKKEFFALYKWIDLFLEFIDKEFPEAAIFIITDSGMRLADTPTYCTGAETIELFKKLGINMQLYAYDVYPPSLPKAKPKIYLPQRSAKEKEKILKMLSEIKIKSTGKNLIQDIKWEEDYLSFSFNFHPSLVNYKSGNLDLILPGGERFKLWITKLTGVSVPWGGAFIAKGPSIREDFYIGRVNTIDIAPTILHYMNIKIPEYMDGKILRKLIIHKNSNNIEI